MASRYKGVHEDDDYDDEKEEEPDQDGEAEHVIVFVIIVIMITLIVIIFVTSSALRPLNCLHLLPHYQHDHLSRSSSPSLLTSLLLLSS